MSGPEDYSFVPPTLPESARTEYAHLQVDIPVNEQRFDMNPLQLFDELKSDLVSQEDITAEDIVIFMQNEAQRSLNIQGIKNLLGWATEEIVRYRDSELLEQMSKTERHYHLWGVEIDFEDPKPKRSAA